MNSHLRLYKIDSAYLKFLHKIDSRISVKFNNRPFVEIITMINGIEYVLPLTSQTTTDRRSQGKQKRSPIITVFVKDSTGREIANILLNNMLPVKSGVYTALTVDPRTDIYELNEIRYIRKNKERIIAKALSVHAKRISGNNSFFKQDMLRFPNT